jgi:hypothetical protein
MRMARPIDVVCLAGLLIVGMGCQKAAPKTEPMLCYMAHGAEHPVRARDWVDLITRPKLLANQLFADQDCTGHAIWWEPPDEDCLVKTPLLEPPRPDKLREGDVFERTVAADLRLVWIVTHRFANGDGFGPIAVVRIHRKGLEVEAIGTLRLRTERVKLELWHVRDRAIVVATGETCTDRNDRRSCRRASNVLIHSRKVLFSPMLTYPNGRCIDEPWIELRRVEDLPLESGWNRHFELRSTLSHDDRYFVISEQVAISDSDPNEPNSPAGEVRRIDTQRYIHLQGSRLVTRQHPLWPRVLPSAGSIELTDLEALQE